MLRISRNIALRGDLQTIGPLGVWSAPEEDVSRDAERCLGSGRRPITRHRYDRGRSRRARSLREKARARRLDRSRPATSSLKRQLGMVGLSGLTVTTRGCWHGDDWARRDVQQPHHHTAQEQSRNRPVPASAHDDQICPLLPSDVRDLMRGLGTDVINDPETRSEPILRELLDSLLKLRLHRILVGIHGKPIPGRVVLDDVDHNKRSRVVTRERLGDLERSVGLW